MKIICYFVLSILFAPLLQAQLNPPSVGAYKSNGSGGWTPAISTATTGAIFSPPPGVALYCYNSSTNKWVPADSSCFGGGGGGAVNTIGVTTANGVSGVSSGGGDPRLTITLGAITPSLLTIHNTNNNFIAGPQSSTINFWSVNGQTSTSQMEGCYGGVDNNLYCNAAIGGFVITSSGAALGTFSASGLAMNSLPITATLFNGVALTAAGSSSLFLNQAGTYTSPGGSSAFSALTGSTNTTAAMVVGTGASLGVSGTGTIAATSAPASGLTGTTLPAAIVSSSLTSLGTITSLNAAALTISGITGSTQCLQASTSGVVSGTGSACGSGGSTAFSALTGSTNTTAAMVVGTGASLAVSGSGTIAATSAPLAGISGLGTGVGTFLGTPSSANLAAAVTDETGTGALVFGTAPTITLANGTGLPISTGVSGLGTGVATFLATPSSANLAAAVTNETGTGLLVFATGPTITLANATGLPLTTGVTGNLPNANLASQTANTVLGALTATTPSGLAVPSCSTASSALTWTTGTGFGCNTISGSGNTTSTSLTTNTIPKANGANSIINSSLSDNGTTVSTSEPLTAGSSIGSTADGVHPSYLTLVGNTTNPSLTTNTFGLLGPTIAAPTAYAWQVPNATNASAGVMHVAANSGGISALSISTIVGSDMTNATVTATQLAAQYSKGSCTEAWGGSGTSFALVSGDDSISNQTCFNDSGVTRTITAVKCRASGASNTTTVNPTFGSAGTGTTILSGALTCGSSGAYSSSGTVSNGAWATGNSINPVMGGTLTGTSIALIIEYTF